MLTTTPGEVCGIDLNLLFEQATHLLDKFDGFRRSNFSLSPEHVPETRFPSSPFSDPD